MSATRYVVLRRSDGDETWTQLDKQYESSSAQSAAKAGALACGVAGDYVAVPSRSWDPVALTIETNPRVKVAR